MDIVLKEGSISKKAIKTMYFTAAICFAISFIFLIITFSGEEWERDNPFWYAHIWISLAFLLFTVIALVFCLITQKMKITVTNNSVCGKTYFGREVDLPLDSISAVASSWMKGIAVASSSGKISFLFIENATEIKDEIRKLLSQRQGQKNTHVSSVPLTTTDELKKFKELLDSGVITQEEFETKKKQLLGF